jgi:membrane protein YqaA with SNARE-associated domain
MIFKIHAYLQSLLQRHAVTTYYPAFTGLVACGCAVSAIPFVPVLMAAVLISPAQWRSISLFTSMGSALGGVLVLIIFHHLGWVQVMESHPEWFASDMWQMMLHWLTDWGVWALAVIAATPLPQSPALFFLAMTDQSWWAMWGALAGGKLIKYGSVAYLTARFPEKLAQFRENRFNKKNAITDKDLTP